MRTSNRVFPSRAAMLTAAIAIAGTLATAAAATTVEDCKKNYDARVNACYADTSYMKTATQMHYCLQRAKNKYINCMYRVVDAISGGSLQLDPGTPPRPPRTPGALTKPGLLEQSPNLRTQGPAGGGTTAPAPTAPSLR